MGHFPYTVNEDYAKLKDNRCCCTSMPDGWHSVRCKRQVKTIIDRIGFCGIHTRSILNWRKK